MTNEEKAKDYAKDKHPNDILREIVLAAAKIEKERIIEKACEWLSNNIKANMNIIALHKLITEDFKKAMEE